MRAVVALAAPVLALAVAMPAPALGHGPCGCLDPRIVEAGGRVRMTDDGGGRQAGGVGYPAYRVVLNPAPADLGIAPAYLASAHRRDAPTTTVLSRSPRRPTRHGRFAVPPATPSGVFLVLIFDGGEGGAHNTWDYLHVVDRDVAEPAAARAGEDRPAVSSSAIRETAESPAASRANTVGVGVGALILGAVLALVAMRVRAR